MRTRQERIIHDLNVQPTIDPKIEIESRYMQTELKCSLPVAAPPLGAL